MENDKIFELLQKMHGEMNSRFDILEKDVKGVKQDITLMKQDLSSVHKDITSMLQDLSSVHKDVTSTQKDVSNIYAKIDSDIDDKLRSLGDGYKVNYDITILIRDKVEENSKSIDDLSIALYGMKDDVNYIANKIIRQDGRINKIEKQIYSRMMT